MLATSSAIRRRRALLLIAGGTAGFALLGCGGGGGDGRSSLAEAAAVDAKVIYLADLGSQPMPVPGSLSTSFTATAGAATLAFTLKGFFSVDGDNDFIDVFHLIVNGADVFSGTFDMGGGGANRVFFSPPGTMAAPVSFGSFMGGKTDIVVPIMLVDGTNTIIFSYQSPTFCDSRPRAGQQDFGDEAFGVGAVEVSSAAA